MSATGIVSKERYRIAIKRLRDSLNEVHPGLFFQLRNTIRRTFNIQTQKLNRQRWEKVNETPRDLNDMKLISIEIRTFTERSGPVSDERRWRRLKLWSMDKWKAVIICWVWRSQNVISPRVFLYRGSSFNEKNPKKRERNSIWAILDILIRLGNVTYDVSAIRYLVAVNIRCLSFRPFSGWYRWQCVVLPTHNVSFYPFCCSQPIPSRFFRPHFHWTSVFSVSCTVSQRMAVSSRNVRQSIRGHKKAPLQNVCEHSRDFPSSDRKPKLDIEKRSMDRVDWYFAKQFIETNFREVVRLSSCWWDLFSALLYNDHIV